VGIAWRWGRGGGEDGGVKGEAVICSLWRRLCRFETLEQLVGCDVSLRELERLVDDAEADPALRRVLRRCRTRRALILMARRLGYRISRLDLQRALGGVT
jgi:hypothetical protein